ncbi:MAG TPA: DNA-binding protein [Steroidobacter sp.]|uniref:DNA-binding protein n=1 Tax=Steroidobacter sp. TaxID=1978227 RepID=UPI002EDA78F5
MNADATDLPRRAPRISAQDVFAAADALLGEGHKPTIDRVRVRLGRGSPNTINEHLEVWWRELGIRFRESAGLALPGVPEAIGQHLVELWNLALGESRQSLHAALLERELALTERSQALDAREQALTEREAAVQARLEAQAAALALAERQLEEANQRARVLEVALAQRDQELEQARHHRAGVEGELSQLREQLSAEQASHTAERERLNERYDLLQNRSAQDIDRLHQAQREDQKRLQTLRAERDHLVKEHAEAQAEATRWSAELQALKTLARDASAGAKAGTKTKSRRRKSSRKVARARS